MLAHLRQQCFPEDSIVLYGSRSCHTSGDFLRVYNEGMPGWSEIANEFDAIDFGANMNKWMDADGRVNVEPGERGNAPVHGGFSTQDLRHRTKEKKVAYPGVNKDTYQNLPNMIALTKIANKLKLGSSFNQDVPQTRNRPGGTHKGAEELDGMDLAGLRYSIFAGNLDPDNGLEGTTAAVSDPSFDSVYVHLDTKNDQSDGMAFALVASVMITQTDVDAQDDSKLLRLVQIGYQRKVCGDFLERYKQLFILLEHIDDYIETLPQHRLGFKSSYLKEQARFLESIDGVAYAELPNVDKKLFLSAFAYIITQLKEKYELGEYEVADLLEVIPKLTEPTKFYRILSGWMRDGLPKTRGKKFLSRSFYEECVETYGCYQSGPRSRVLAFANNPQSNRHHQQSIQTIVLAARKMNDMKVSHKHCTMNTLLDWLRNGSKDRQTDGIFGVHYAGEFTVQHLSAVMVMTGFVRHGHLLSEAHVASTTETYRRLKSVYGFDASQVSPKKENCCTVATFTFGVS